MYRFDTSFMAENYKPVFKLMNNFNIETIINYIDHNLTGALISNVLSER